jgi:outer membrane protein OmpA-like peptidoglycan-associated protein
MKRVAAILTALALASGLAGCILPGPAYYMDGQEAELRRALAGTPVRVIRKGDAIILRMPSDVTFAFDRADLDPAFHPVLTTMAQTIAKYGQTRVQVSGHADAMGSDAYNLALSERRASTVGAFLEARGVQHSRLALAGYGENSPIASNDTEEGRATNRRVEVMLQPMSVEAIAPVAKVETAAPAY